MDLLQVGDIILTASPGQTVSALIRAITGSDYSHAILVLDPPYAIESSDYGVVKFRLDRFAVRKQTNILVGRVRAQLQSMLDIPAMVGFADRMKTREYAENDMFTALFDAVPRFEQGKFFCSQLVAEAYLAGGLPVVPNKKPEKVTPGMLATSSIFENLQNCLSFTKAPDLPFIPAFLDGPNQQTPAEREAEARQQAVSIAGPAFEHHGRLVHDFYQALTTLVEVWSKNESYTVELDKAFAGAILESGLPKITSELFPGHANELFIDFYIRNAIVLDQISLDQQRKLLDRYRKEQVRMQATNAERDKDVTALKEMYLRTGLESVRLHLAGCWEFFLVSRRIELARQRAIDLLAESLNKELES